MVSLLFLPVSLFVGLRGEEPALSSCGVPLTVPGVRAVLIIEKTRAVAVAATDKDNATAAATNRRIRKTAKESKENRAYRCRHSHC